MTHCVLGHYAGFDELEEVVGAAGLRADPGAAVASKWLTTDHRSSDVAVYIEVSDRCPADDVIDRRGAAREEAAGEREGGSVDRIARGLHLRYALDRKHGAEDLLAQHSRIGRQ